MTTDADVVRRQGTGPFILNRVLIAVVLLAVGGAALSGFTDTSRASPGPTVLPDCLGKPVVRPAQVIFTCADANFGARKLRWTGWGSAFAAAIGVAYANDCKPNCAAGKFHTYQAVVIASGSERRPNGTVAYAKETIAFIGPSPYPKAKPADFEYPLHCGPR